MNRNTKYKNINVPNYMDPMVRRVLIIAENVQFESLKELLSSKRRYLHIYGLKCFWENTNLNLFNLCDIDDDLCNFILENFDILLIKAFDNVISTALRDNNGNILTNDRGETIYDENYDGYGLDVAYKLVELCPELKDRLAILTSYDEYSMLKTDKPNDKRIKFLEETKPLMYNHYSTTRDNEITRVIQKLFHDDPRNVRKTKIENYFDEPSR